MNWIEESNRTYHVLIGFLSALFGSLIGAIEVACVMEGKDCQDDPINQGVPSRRWTWRRWDWLDWLATVMGGVVGQMVQLVIVWVVWTFWM